MPLLRGHFEVSRGRLIKPVLAIVKTAGGKYNFEQVRKESTGGPALDLTNLTLSDVTWSFHNQKTGEHFAAKGIDAAVKNFSVAPASEEALSNVSFTGTLTCKELVRKDLKIENIEGPMQADKGVYSLKPLVMGVFGGKGAGDFTVDITKPDAVYEINVKISNLDFEKLEESFGMNKMIGGKGDLSASLADTDKERRTLISELDGTLAFGGDNLVALTMDLDKVLSAYKSSQKFHLTDLAAYFVAGPLGAVALKGYRYGDLYYQAQGGSGVITRFSSQWNIKNGEAEATDCALATRHNRVALKGRLNLDRERFEDVTVAIVDDNGCAVAKQTISGSFDNPRLGTMSAVEESLAGPFLDLYRKAKRFVQGGKCEVFYSGSVQQPR